MTKSFFAKILDLKTLESLTAIGAQLVAIFGGIIAVYLYASTTLHTALKERDDAFAGSWMSENKQDPDCEDCITSPMIWEDNPITLKLSAADGQIFGEMDISKVPGAGLVGFDKKHVSAKYLAAAKFISDQETRSLFVTGNLTFHIAKVDVWAFREGRKKIYARGEASLQGPTLRWKTTSDYGFIRGLPAEKDFHQYADETATPPQSSDKCQK